MRLDSCKKSLWIVVLIGLIHCSENNNPVLPDNNEYYNGRDRFVFKSDSLNFGRSIKVYTYIPENYTADSPVLFVIHGSSRNPEEYREAWIDIAERNNAVLLCPDFSKDNFPYSRHFNMGNMFEMDSDDNILSSIEENNWSYSLIDPIFNYAVENMNNNSNSYLIYGHSAGSQFVHRMLFFKPEAKILKAVCANAGWYTMPDFQELFPYGMKGTQCNQEILTGLFEQDITILLGENDTDTESSSLRQTPEAMQQGIHRFERGYTFYNNCKEK
ncbi:MAG: hypothetical protein GY863_06325, partial [bacterium]|nr:hypothetical protein [bacterium]